MKDSPLKIIADNQILLDELRKVFDAEIETSNLELGFSNERLGERVRAKLEAKLVLERAFSKIMSFQTPVVKVNERNPAR